MVISTVTLIPSAKRHGEVLEILRSIVGPAKSQPGCLSCHLFVGDEPDKATILCGFWKTPAALRGHILSDLYDRVLAACELSSQPPKFCFHHVSKTQGMDLIQHLRGRSEEPSSALPQPQTN